MILNDDVGMVLLYHARKFAKHSRLTNACHVLQTDFGGSCFNQLIRNRRVIFGRMNGASGDTEGGLRYHTAFLRPLDAWNDVAHIVQATEDAGDVSSLLLLHLVHKLANVVGHGIHAESVEAAVEHVSLDTYFVEGFTEGTNCLVGVLTSQEVHLLESTAIGFNAVEATHLDDDRRNACQLILARLELAAALPHVSIYETESYFLLHYVFLRILGAKLHNKFHFANHQSKKLILFAQF